MPVGDARFWLIGRDTNNPGWAGPPVLWPGGRGLEAQLEHGRHTPLIASNQLIWLPRMTVDLTQAILDWVNTNGTGPTATYYAMQQPSYQCKCEPFETVDELRLLYGADMDTLVGEDANRNGILDPNETDDNQNGMLDPGVLEYVTVYSREPNTNSDGSAKVNISSAHQRVRPIDSLLQTNFGASRASEILAISAWGAAVAAGPRRGRARQRTAPAAADHSQPPPRRQPASPARCSSTSKSGMTIDRVCSDRHESHHDQRQLTSMGG